MTVTVKNIIPAKYAEDTQTSQYTAQSCRTIIDKFTATNVTASNATLSVNIVPSGGTAGTGNLIISVRTIAPGETYTCPEIVGHVVEPNCEISTDSDSSSAIVIAASGREVT